MQEISAQKRLEEAAIELGPRAIEESHENLHRLIKALEWIEPKIANIENPTIIDVGCGLGAIDCALVMQKRANIFGMDKFVWQAKSDANHFGMTQEEHASATATWQKYGIKLQEADIDMKWPFEDSMADLVISNAVFEHLNGAHKFFLEEAYRALKPGGVFSSQRQILHIC